MPSDIPDVMSELTIPTGWDCALLGSLVEEKPGISYGIVQPGKHDSNGIPIVRVNNLRTGRILVDDVLRVGTEIEANYSRTRLRGGEVLLSLVGTLGECAVVPKELAGWNVARAVAVIPLQVNIDPHWVAMCLRSASVRNLIRAWATTTVQATLNLRDVRRLPILLAPQPDRDHITQVIKQLDDKIEQNRRTARALERLARAIFRAWFVDFEPVKAKAAGATAFPSMPQPVFEALPTRFVDSDIGPVPEGWEVKPLGEVVQLTMGQSPKSEFYNQKGKGLPFHQGVSDHSFRFPTRRVYCTVEGRIAEEGDILLSVRAPVGRINVADVRMVLGRGLAGMRHLSGRQSLLLYQMQHLFAEDDAVGDGTIYKSVNKKYLQAMPLLAASTDAEEAFERIARPMDKLISSVVLESRQLAAMRDYLLPKLLSGQVRVERGCD